MCTVNVVWKKKDGFSVLKAGFTVLTENIVSQTLSMEFMHD